MSLILLKYLQFNPIEVSVVLFEETIEYLQKITRQQITSQRGKTKEMKKLELLRETDLEGGRKKPVVLLG